MPLAQWRKCNRQEKYRASIGQEMVQSCKDEREAKDISGVTDLAETTMHMSPVGERAGSHHATLRSIAEVQPREAAAVALNISMLIGW